MKLPFLHLHRYFGNQLTQEQARHARFCNTRFAVCAFAVLMLSNYIMQYGVPRGALGLIEPRSAEAGIVITHIDETPALPEMPAAQVALIVAKQWIEPGTSLRPEMFEIFRAEKTLVPARVLREEDMGAISGRYARAAIEPGTMISLYDLSSSDRFKTEDIPVGFRAVSVGLNARSGVEGFAQPGSLVDVLWVASDPRDREDKVATVADRARVLALAGSTSREARGPAVGSYNATLVVPEETARRVELAAQTGEISFALIGDYESAADTGSSRPTAFTSKEILRPRRAPGSDYCVTRDPVSGKPEKYVLTDHGWEKAAQAAAPKGAPEEGAAHLEAEPLSSAAEEPAQIKKKGKVWYANS